MAKTKLILRVNTVGAKRGDEIEVDADTAQHLIDNGHALRKKDATPAQSRKD